ncbi:hypothetical protein Tco_0884525 [Tanacetum coccineum]
MRRDFLSQNRSGGGRGVKEKNKGVAAKDVVSPSVIDEPVVMEKHNSLVDTSIHNVKKTSLSSSMDGLNAMLKNGPWFIRNHQLILKKWNPDVNLLKEDVGNVLVWVKLHGVPVTAFNEDVLGRSSYAKAMIELWADVELKDTIVEECPKNIGSGEAKNLKKPSQTPQGVLAGLKVGFNPPKEYRPFGTNGGTSNLASNGANSSGSSFWNVETSCTSTTPIVNKIRKLKKLIIDGKVTLVDDDAKPLKKVDYLGDHDSEDEIESVDNDMARSMASKRVGFGTKSLLEQ